MNIKPLHPNFTLPVRSTSGAGAFDIFMPESGACSGNQPTKVPLGFAASVPKGHVALLLPRSGTGFKYGVELNNTCGVIDEDFTGQWVASLRTKDGDRFQWAAGERVLQFLIVPVLQVALTIVDSLEQTERGEGGFGSTGQ